MTPQEQIAQLKQQQHQVKAKFAARRARINKELRRVRTRIAALERKKQTRRMIIVGGALLDETRADPLFREQVAGILSRRLQGQNRYYFEEWQADSPQPAAVVAEGRLRRWARRLAALTPSWLRFSKETS